MTKRKFAESLYSLQRTKMPIPLHIYIYVYIYMYTFGTVMVKMKRIPKETTDLVLAIPAPWGSRSKQPNVGPIYGAFFYTFKQLEQVICTRSNSIDQGPPNLKTSGK